MDNPNLTIHDVMLRHKDMLYSQLYRVPLDDDGGGSVFT